MQRDRVSKSKLKKLIKICGHPDDFCWENIVGASGTEESIRRMKEYIRCVNKIFVSKKK